MADKNASPVAAPTAPPLTPRQQAILEWHDATTEEKQRAVVEKFKGISEADLRAIYAPAAQLGVK